MTLMELIIALVLLSMIILGITNLEIFCRHAFMSTDRKTKVTNEATYILEHMSKFIGNAIGDGSDYPVSVSPAIGGCDRFVRVWTKVNLSEPGKAAADREIAYCFNNTAHTVTFYPRIRTWPDLVSEDHSKETLSRNVYEWDAMFDSHQAYVNATVTVCWNATTECGSVDNPRIKLDTRISMPAVSANATPL